MDRPERSKQSQVNLMKAVSMSTLPLESVRPDDLDALVALEQRCFTSDRLSRRSFRRWLEGDQRVLLVARDGDRLAGYILVLFHRGTRLARMYSLAVDPDYRGQGLARRLIGAGEDGARDSGRFYMRLEVSSKNTSAIALYETLGYKQFGLYQDYYEDHTDTRGYRAEVWVNHDGPLFLDGVRDETKKPVMMLVHEDYRHALEARAVPVHYREVRQDDLIAAFDRGGVPIILISTYRIDSKKAPHWVVMSGYDEECIYVHDPDPDGQGQTALDCQYLPLARADFERMTSFGRSRLRTAVILSRELSGPGE